ncbi:YeiH family protein [Salinirubellus sp. GCM10025818]|uniref:YeiH family protein n=1 Tax=Salinirubellus TaxID=2162630 RepID=UPI0030D3211D
MSGAARRLIPGLALLALVALLARFLGSSIPFLTPLVVAVAIGAVAVNLVDLPGVVEPGLEKHSLLLETAIVLLGASLSLDAILTAGPLIVALVLFVVGFGVLLVTGLARVGNLDRRMGSLLAAGSSICGVSAIAAVAPACEARKTQIAHAAATILLFDAVTLVAFPAVGSVLELDPRFYGVWIGLSMFSTGPVAAAGFAHSATAGEWATMTKLARNALIGVVVLGYSLSYTGRSAAATEQPVRRIWADFPKFLFGFVSLAVIVNAGLLSDAVVSTLTSASGALFLLAFAGLGFEIRLAEMRETGLVPVGIVGVYLLVVSGVTYGIVTLLL